MTTVLFVDDEESLRRAVRAALERAGHTVHTASTLARAIQCLRRYTIDGVFVDVWLGKESGFDLVSWLQDNQPRLAKRVVFVTGDVASPTGVDRGTQALGLPVLAKPFEIAELEAHARVWGAVPGENTSTGATLTERNGSSTHRPHTGGA